MSASFRDPAGQLLFFNHRVIRKVNRLGASQLKRFLTTRVNRDFVASGRLVNTTVHDVTSDPDLLQHPLLAGSQTDTDLLVEHERIALRSFPYEWAPEMLFSAGLLTLDLAEASLAEGFSLKDATPYNVLFEGSRAVFVDVLSFEERDAHDPTWLAFNQFAQTFLLPLLANKHYGLRLDQLLTVNRDGLEPAQVAKLTSPLRKLSPVFFSLVSAAHWLSKKQPVRDESIYKPKRLNNPERAKFILQQQLRRLRRQLMKVAPSERGKSNWSNYMTPEFVSADYLKAKEQSVVEMLNATRPQRVLDVGCNTGHFSTLAAQSGASVVSIDQDPDVVGAVFRRAKNDTLNILPLVVNLARPTPGLGWRNEECPSFLERTRGQFDLLMMLAVVHHMLVVDQIPLAAVLELAFEITTKNLIIEFVDPNDPMFRHLVRGRGELYADLTRESFESTARTWFQITNQIELTPTRTLYSLRKTEH